MNDRRRLTQKVRIQTYTGHTYIMTVKRTSNEKIKYYLDTNTVNKLVMIDLHCGINRFHYISNGEYSFHDNYSYTFFKAYMKERDRYE